MDKLKYVRIREGMSSNDIPIGADASNIDLSNGKNLQDTLGDYDYTTKGSVKNRIDNLDSVTNNLTTTVNTKANQADLNNLTSIVNTKANETDLNDLTTIVTIKADQEDLNDLTTIVNTKANQADLNNFVTTFQNDIASLKNLVGSPLIATTAAQMVNTNRIYVYTGNQTGYINGNWYYYNGISWVSGGVYNSLALETDETLSIEGVAADAKVAGDKISNLNNQINEYTGNSEILMIDGAYYAVNGESVTIGSPIANSSKQYALVPCGEGDTFTISASGGNIAQPWAFVSSNGTVLSRTGNSSTVTLIKQVITAPSRTAYLIINNNKADALKSYKGVLLTNRIDQIDDNINQTSKEIDILYKATDSVDKGYINYGYDTTANLPEGSSVTERIGVKRRKEIVTINGIGKNQKIKINGTVVRTTTNTTVESWVPTVQFKEDHVYLLSTELISGTAIDINSEGILSISAYLAGTHNTIGILYTSPDRKTSVRLVIGDGNLYSLALFAYQNTIYTNADFLVRVQDVTNYKLPSMFEPLDYIESNRTFSLGTAYYCNQDTRIICDFQFCGSDLDNSSYVFGSRYNLTTQSTTFGIYNKQWMFGYNNSYTLSGKADYDRHIVDLNKNELYLDGKKLSTMDYADFSSRYVLSIFGLNGRSLYTGAFRVYRMKVYDSDNLVCDIYPCKNIITNDVGFYDTIKHRFVTNQNIIQGKRLDLLQTNENFSNDLHYDLQTVKDEVDQLSEKIPKGYKDYTIAEADRVAEKVRSVQTGNTLSFIAISDLHYKDGDLNIKKALEDMRDGIKLIANQVSLDFYASFGDVIYRLSTTTEDTFDIGKREMIAVTKIISDSFGNNSQIRMIGNHDPNSEGISGYFTPNELNSFSGKFSNMIIKNALIPFGAYGFHDFETQKIRLIVLNTSYYADTPSQRSTMYGFGYDQADWLAQTLDLTQKSDAFDWQIVIMAHIRADRDSSSSYRLLTRILDAYQKGLSFTQSSRTYNFVDKNLAKLAVYINGHEHEFHIRNLTHLDTDGSFLNTLEMANLYIPNALPGRNYPSFDGITYAKTADTAESTSFSVITIDGDNKIVYSHHYGAGIDFILHYLPTTETQFITNLQSPTWGTLDETIATVSNGTVTGVETGNVMIYAKSENDNCVEAWNYNSII